MIMKKIIFTILISMSVLGCQMHKKAVSGNRDYQSFSQFKNDTLGYAKANFEKNKSFYIGKTVQVLVDDIEVPFQSIPGTITITETKADGSVFMREEYNTIEFRLSNYDIANIVHNKKKYTAVTIVFDKNVSATVYSDAIKKANAVNPQRDPYAWQPVNSEAFGKCIIKNLSAVEYDFSDPNW
jgi:hypothetical protein